MAILWYNGRCETKQIYQAADFYIRSFCRTILTQSNINGHQNDGSVQKSAVNRVVRCASVSFRTQTGLTADFCVLGGRTLKRRKTTYKSGVTWSKMIMLYGQYCAYCGQEPAQSIDHVIPWDYSYNDDIENLRPACMWCNLHAGSKMFSSFEEKQSWLRAKRTNGRGVASRTICTTCFLPYQRPHMTTSLFECPFCDPEKSTDNRRKEWNKFLFVLKSAGVRLEIHEEIRDLVKNHGMRMREARQELGELYIQAILGRENDDFVLMESSYFG